MKFKFLLNFKVKIHTVKCYIVSLLKEHLTLELNNFVHLLFYIARQLNFNQNKVKIVVSVDWSISFK